MRGLSWVAVVSCLFVQARQHLLSHVWDAGCLLETHTHTPSGPEQMTQPYPSLHMSSLGAVPGPAAAQQRAVGLPASGALQKDAHGDQGKEHFSVGLLHVWPVSMIRIYDILLRSVFGRHEEC